MANEATKILHGETAAKKAEKTSQKTFEIGGIGTDLPEIKIEKNILKNGIKLLDLLSTKNIFLRRVKREEQLKEMH